ncbi:hypothetical protein [Lentilactobacillus sp. SPB1-3]|uniref:Uncharacterized protein n=1 Tax=Lentilactobacillus terminaliae TaxID=3003483 RepID=A0ACD5DFI7_9LACO|nr:hypothetical protein [Lentilactobacillus sp. SPB1-3]MCZ0977619.1 hypothetical protein [Lentilactobacillus sp. SPB1-3]
MADKLRYKTKVDLNHMLVNHSLMTLKVPTIQARQQAQRMISDNVDQGITPYYLKKETLSRLSGTHYE